jgi:hypothetical protein
VSSEGAENDEYPKAGQNSCLGFVVSSTEGRALGIVEDVVVGSEGLLVALIVRGAEPSVTAIARDEIVHVGLEERRILVERRRVSRPQRPWWLGRRRTRPSR